MVTHVSPRAVNADESRPDSWRSNGSVQAGSNGHIRTPKHLSSAWGRVPPATPRSWGGVYRAAGTITLLEFFVAALSLSGVTSPESDPAIALFLIGIVVMCALELALCLWLASEITAIEDRFLEPTHNNFDPLIALPCVVGGIGLIHGVAIGVGQGVDSWFEMMSPVGAGIAAVTRSVLFFGSSFAIAVMLCSRKTNSEIAVDQEQERQHERRREVEAIQNRERARRSQLIAARQESLKKYLSYVPIIETELSLKTVKALIDAELPDMCSEPRLQLQSVLTAIQKRYHRARTRQIWVDSREYIDVEQLGPDEYRKQFQSLLSMSRSLAEVEEGAKQLIDFITELAESGKQAASKRAQEAIAKRQAKEKERSDRIALSEGQQELREWFLMNAAHGGWPHSLADFDRYVEDNISECLPLSQLAETQCKTKNHFLREHFVEQAKRRYAELKPYIEEKFSEEMLCEFLDLFSDAEVVRKKADELLVKLDELANPIRACKQQVEMEQRNQQCRLREIENDKVLLRRATETFQQEVEREADDSATPEEKSAEVLARLAKWMDTLSTPLHLA